MNETAALERQGRASLRRLLVINPNINPVVTNGVREAAGQVIDAATTISVVNPQSGPLSIETPADREAAAPGVIALIRESLGSRYDAYVLACFDDIALFEARAIAGVPVVGTCEAGMAAARTFGRQFAIVTTVHSAVPRIHELVERYGAAGICTVRAAGVGVAAAAAGEAGVEARIVRTIRDAVEEDGAEAILLGSGGLVGWADRLRAVSPVPVIDGVLAAVKMAEGLAAQLSREPR